MKEAKLILVLAAICIGLVVWRLSHRTGPAPVNQAENSNQQTASKSESDNTNVTPSSLPPRPKVPAPKPEVIKEEENNFSFKVDPALPKEQKELQAINNYARAMYLFTSDDQKPEGLVKKLTEAGLKPLVVQDFNDVTGKMIVIRTDETLPGTRYFHAQYFEDENRQPFLQHVSVEFRAGEMAFEEATAAIQKQFPASLGAPKNCAKKFRAWGYGEMTAWCRELDEEDIKQDDPFNAHGPEDVGTIRCAVEQNPHPHEDLCGD